MQYEKTEFDNILVIRLKDKRLEIDDIERFRNDLLNLPNDGFQNLIIDLENIERIDSSGIGIFISFWKTHGKENILTFINVRAHIKNIFHYANLDKIFKIYSSLDEAIQSFH